jgi:hypothetical protein
MSICIYIHARARAHKHTHAPTHPHTPLHTFAHPHTHLYKYVWKSSFLPTLCSHSIRPRNWPICYGTKKTKGVNFRAPKFCSSARHVLTDKKTKKTSVRSDFQGRSISNIYTGQFLPFASDFRTLLLYLITPAGQKVQVLAR